ncbi:MAG: NfeD family protein [Breznakia sp.]
MNMTLLMWIVIFFSVCAIEATSLQLVAIWFAIGSFVCVFLAYLGVDIGIQLAIFIIVSIISMLLFRPYALRRLNVNRMKTAPENVIGKNGIVSTHIHGPEYMGRARVEGMDWAILVENKCELHPGDIIKVLRIDGVKLIVKGE